MLSDRGVGPNDAFASAAQGQIMAKRVEGTKAGAAHRRRGRKPYPVTTFEEALKIPLGIMQHAAGEPVRRLRLLQLMDMSPSSQATRDAITNSAKYAMTEGHHSAEELKLTERGRMVVDPTAAPRARRQAAFELSIASVPSFKKLYDIYHGKPMPALEIMQDALHDLDKGDRQPCVDVFIGNASYVGLLKTIGGSKHLLAIEDALDDLARAGDERASSHNGATAATKSFRETDSVDFSKICFFIAPIGDAKSDDAEKRKHRQHSDTILNQYVRRALDEQALKVVRADEIAEPGMISKQIVEHILNSALVIADLSYENPNVFYELCLRHVTGKPTVHLIRKGDKIPFDVANFRTITIALDDVHEAIAELDTHRAGIANFVRQAMAAGASGDNPILTYYPKATFAVNDA
ncbi:MAG TPA: hypothetical protein VHZ24_14885 [Pirellulales bacterium]|nr:hypothetical protein [Pirellulales bacterium]